MTIQVLYPDRPVSLRLRNEALRLLSGKGDILATARAVSVLMRDQKIRGAVIGGVATVLHGHVRTTVDVDVFTFDSPEALGSALDHAGFIFDADRREYSRDGIPVHLVRPEDSGIAPREITEIEGITTISLADLISMKLRSGSTNPLRAQDLADVIGLIRYHGLTAAFTPAIDASVRKEYERFVKLLS